MSLKFPDNMKKEDRERILTFLMEAHIAGLKAAEEKLQEFYIQFEQECIQKMLTRGLREEGTLETTADDKR